MVNAQEYGSRFRRDGFTVVRRFLFGAELAELRDHLERYIRDVVPGLPASDAFYDDRDRPETLKQLHRMGQDPFFRDYVHHASWKGFAEDLLGEEANCESPEWFGKPPGSAHPTPPHQDNYYFNLAPPNVLTIWLALDRVDAENGCLRYVSRSHLAGPRPHGASRVLGFSQGITDYGAAEEAMEVPVYLELGDAVVHHGWTIHRAGPNRSATRPRRAFAMVFKGRSCRRDEEGYRRYQDELQRQLSQKGLQT